MKIAAGAITFTFLRNRGRFDGSTDAGETLSSLFWSSDLNFQDEPLNTGHNVAEDLTGVLVSPIQ